MGFFNLSDDTLHRENEQLKRIKNASKLKMDFVDFENQTGKIKDYDVSLEKCTCFDFGRRHKPCKHIYRLAMELGVFSVEGETLRNTEHYLASKTDNENSIIDSFDYVFSCYEPLPKNFVVIDFETANKFPDSICQIGIVVVEDNSITEEKEFLICPPYEKFTFTDIHGITFEDVMNKPTFSDLWQQIETYINSRMVAAYNMLFDLKCLKATLRRYGISCPNFKVFDILASVRACRYQNDDLLELENYKLATVAKKLGLFHKAHDALSDALVTAQVQIYLAKKINVDNIMVYFPTLSSLTKAIAENQISDYAIAGYFIELFRDNEQINYEEYKELFKIIEQIAASHDNAVLYKYCGMFYEKNNRIPRAISLYEKALTLNEKIGVKGKTQKLKRNNKI